MTPSLKLSQESLSRKAKPSTKLMVILTPIKDGENGDRSDTLWELRLEFPSDVPGKRQRKTVRFRGDNDEADSELQRRRNLYSDSRLIQPSEMTLAEYLKGWLDRVKSDGSDYSLRRLTWEGYRHICENHIIPALGMVPLAELQPHHVAVGGHFY